jgi:hypothetical protein
VNRRRFCRLESLKIINIVKEGNTFRIVLETPKGVTRIWITDTEYRSNKIKEIVSNAASYLEKYRDEIEKELIKYKNS